MSEVITGIIVAVIVGGASWLTAWNQRQGQADEAADREDAASAREMQASASATRTITETAKGLLITVDNRLKVAEAELAATREALAIERRRTDELQAVVAELTRRIARYEQTENP